MSQEDLGTSSGPPVSSKDNKDSAKAEKLVSESYLSTSSGKLSLVERLEIPPFPSPDHLSFLLPEEIADAIYIYQYALTLFLQLDRDEFIVASDVTSREGRQMVDFLAAYVNQRASGTPSLSSPDLYEKTFRLIFRFISEGRDISTWIDWQLVVGVICSWYSSRPSELSTLLARLWRRAKSKMIQEFSQLRDHYIHSFESIILDDANDIVPTLTGLRYMVTLNDDIVDLLVDREGEFLTALHDEYTAYRTHLGESKRNAILYLFYTIVVSLAYRASKSSIVNNRKGKGTAGSTENLFFRLFDKLFNEYIRETHSDAFIDDINSATPFAEIMTEWVTEWKGPDEAVEGLSMYLERVKFEEQAQEETPTFEDANELEIEQTSLISQVQDILPHLGDGFIEDCLVAFDWDVESTVAAILSNDLPPKLAVMNQSKKRSAQRSAFQPPEPAEYTIADRHNLFDNDAFDLKLVNPSQVHRGRKERPTPVDILDDKRFIKSQKAKIMKSVESQWDEYEDEYDDTYDDPERSAPANPRLKMIRDDVDEETTESEPEEDIEGIVYGWFKRAPATFEKNARKSRDRETLKQETKWTDEQLEGWKSMIDRDGSRLRRLERTYENKGFNRADLPSTAWRAGAREDEDEKKGWSSDGSGNRGRRTGASREDSLASRGHGRGRDRGGGRGRGAERGRARKDRIRKEFRPDA